MGVGKPSLRGQVTTPGVGVWWASGAGVWEKDYSV